MGDDVLALVAVLVEPRLAGTKAAVLLSRGDPGVLLLLSFHLLSVLLVYLILSRTGSMCGTRSLSAPRLGCQGNPAER